LPHPHTPHAPHPTIKAPLLPEAMLTADSASGMSTFFLEQPVGVCNSGAMIQADVDWYKAAMLKPGGG
jgi:hypothetical protein